VSIGVSSKELSAVRKEIAAQTRKNSKDREAISSMESDLMVIMHQEMKSRLDEGEDRLLYLILKSQILEMQSCNHIFYVTSDRKDIHEESSHKYVSCCRCSLTGRYFDYKSLNLLGPKERKIAEVMNHFYLECYHQISSSLIAHDILSINYAKGLYQRALIEVGNTNKETVMIKMRELLEKDKLAKRGKQKTNNI